MCKISYGIGFMILRVNYVICHSERSVGISREGTMLAR